MNKSLIPHAAGFRNALARGSRVSTKVDRCAREAHEKMGFHEGWGLCTEQLEEVASKL
jgi:hypothetical protein